MTQNLAAKYEAKVDERFYKESFTSQLCNNDYTWDGVNSIYVYDIATSPINNYTLSGTSRYGTPSELNDNTTNYAISQDKAFTFTIDRKHLQDQGGAKVAGEALARELREQVVPAIDKYRIGVMEAGADINYSYGVSITSSNALENVIKGIKALGNTNVPTTDRVLLSGYSFWAKLMLDSNYIKASDLGQRAIFNGQEGLVLGLPHVVVPDEYFASNTNFLIVHKSAVVAPVKLEDYFVHENPVGVSGVLVEGRFRHDAFALKNKKAGIYLNTSGSKPTGATGTGV